MKLINGDQPSMEWIFYVPVGEEWAPICPHFLISMNARENELILCLPQLDIQFEGVKLEH